MTDTERKHLFIARHGVKQKGKGRGNLLTPTSINRLAEIGKVNFYDPIRRNRTSAMDLFGRHSDQERTKRTLKAIVAGALSYHPDYFKSNHRLDNLQIHFFVDVREDPGLSYGEIGVDFHFDVDAYRADEEAYMREWVGNPDAIAYPDTGVKITSFNDVINRGGKTLSQNLSHLISGTAGTKRLGVLSTHGGLIEGIAAAAINSGRDQIGVESVDDIGGMFPTEGYGIFQVDYRPKSGTADARFVRDGQVYDMNLENLSTRYGACA